MRLQYKDNGKVVEVEATDFAIIMNGQYLNLYWDEYRNAFKILTDGKMSVFPSSANGILIKDEGKWK